MLTLIAAALPLGEAHATTPPSFEAAGTAVGASGSVSPAWPAHTVNDVALLIVESAGGEPVTLSTPAGFAAVLNSPQATGSTTNGTRISVFWARATSPAMASPTVADPGNHVYAQILTYRGVIPTGNPWNVTAGGVKATASISVSVTGVTTTVANTLIVQAVSHDLDSSGVQFSGQTNGALSGITERSDGGTTSSNGGGFAVWDGAKASAGATGNTSATLANSVVNAFLTIALAPQPPAVSSINTASADPTTPAANVAWTVTFNSSVTGVNAADFSLVQAGGVSGATITSVTGSGAVWTVNANTGSGSGTLGLDLADDDSITDSSGVSLGGAGAGNGNFSGDVYTVSPPFCSPPANAPAGLALSCVCDTFARAALNPSTIFGGNWIVSTSDQTGILPSIVNQGYLRLTNNTGNNAKAATVPGIFPAAGNYISVEFRQYAYNGSGADGIAVTLSDYSVPAVPGAFGGSLGYAQKTGAACNTASCPGFAGGWLGVALDEFGNYQNPTEGRIGGLGSIPESVGVRGSGAGNNGYNWIAGTNGLNPQIDNNGSATPSLGYYYQVIVDARNDPSSTAVTVNRNTGGGYAQLVNVPNIYTAAAAQGFTQAPVPANWQISFTGSTGGSTNIHEIAGLRICASNVLPPSGGTASGFNAIDEAYGTPPSVAVQNYLTGHIYTKLMGTSFKLNVAALNNNQILTTYALGSVKNVTLKLVNNSDGACVLDSSQPGYCSAACTAKSAVAGGSQTLTFASGAGDKGQKQSASFTLNSAYKNLAAIISDGTTTACSTDSFSVRPLTIAPVVAGVATNLNSSSGTPMLKANADNFSLTATVNGIAANPNGYDGVLKINNAAVQFVSPATLAGSVTGSFGAAVPGTPAATASGAAFKYSEVGAFQLLGYDPASNALSARAVFDGVMTPTECTGPGLTTAQCDTLKAATWTGTDSVSGKVDCVADSFSNTKDANGKYGCNFGLSTTSSNIGRFIPDHFSVVGTLVPRADVIAATTGSITTGSNVLTVASAAGISAGKPITVAGAGADDGTGADGNGLQTTVSFVAGTTVTLAAAAQTTKAGTAVYVHDAFTYMDEPLLAVATVTAYNAAHGVTKNYAGTLAKLNAASLGTGASWMNAGCAAGVQCFGFGAINGTTPLTARLSIDTGIANPSSSWNNGIGTFTAYLRLNRPSNTTPDTTWGPYDSTNFGAVPIDSDGVTLPPAASGDAHQVDLDADVSAPAERRRIAIISERFGRLRLFNTWGSELTSLSAPLQAQYWNGQAWALNGSDNSSLIPTASVALSGQTGALTSTNMGTANVLSAGKLSNGIGSIVLKCPYSVCPPAIKPVSVLTGSVDLAINLGAGSTSDQSCLTSHPATTGAGLSWLRSVNGSCVTSYDRDPWGRMSFGIYSANQSRRSVHIRELF